MKKLVRPLPSLSLGLLIRRVSELRDLLRFTGKCTWVDVDRHVNACETSETNIEIRETKCMGQRSFFFFVLLEIMGQQSLASLNMFLNHYHADTNVWFLTTLD